MSLSYTEIHGALSVKGTDLVDRHGNKIQLYGMSTHGLAWYPQYINPDAFDTLKNEWNTNCIRLAMYTAEPGGYCTDGNKEELKDLVLRGVEYAAQSGMYAIVDWHILSDNNPNMNKEEALAFWGEMSARLAHYNHVLYEICNEPNGNATWEDVIKYANEVIPVIRANDPNTVILVGSPTWSQDIHLAAAAPLSYDNVMYTMHFYAASHKEKLRNRLESCIRQGLPVFISEFGMCDASGNGGNDFVQASAWMELIEKYNLSFLCWNLGNRDESSSVIHYSCDKLSDWSEEDLTQSGNWIRNYFRSKGSSEQ